METSDAAAQEANQSEQESEIVTYSNKVNIHHIRIER